MPESNIRTVARLVAALEEVEKRILNEALPCAAYLRLTQEGGELWQKLEDARLAVRAFLDNHNAVIEPVKEQGSAIAAK